jgi:hypothetical protein
LPPVNPSSRYLLHAYGYSELSENSCDSGRIDSPIIIIDRVRIDVRNLIIDFSDENRFYPGFDHFSFEEHTFVSEDVLLLAYFNSALILMSEDDYPGAYDIMYYIITNHSCSEEAIAALALMPQINSGMGGNVDDLIAFIENIECEHLQNTKRETLALLSLYEENYHEAIDQFQVIVEENECEIERLIAELNQAYAYLKLYESDGRGSMPDAKRQPKSRNEFLSIEEEIMNRINNKIENDNENHENNITAEVPEIFEFSVFNYPNPFNPETTIKYQVSGSTASQNESDVVNVRINVFNVRGQKIRSLVNEYNQPGEYSVVWNGRDDYGKPVGSGVYFYRLEAGDDVAVRRMLLLK